MNHKIFNQFPEAKNQIDAWKEAGEIIVFTNGCFDILHKGHVSYLLEASKKGDKLVVGLNSDSSVKRQNKSPNRPLQDESSRSYVMASLYFVDAVILFEEDTPFKLIMDIKPNILIKGADYKIEDIVGGKETLAWGGEVITIPLIEGYSTSAIERKILE